MAQIVWPPGDVCRKPVQRSTGRLVLKGEEVDKYWEDFFRVEEETYQLNKRTELLALGEPKFEDIPAGFRPVNWYWGHKRCLPKCEHMISARRLDTVGKVLRLTLDQMEDDFFPRTNWRKTVERLRVLS